MIVRRFGRDERPMRLPVPQWRAVEKTCDAGLGVIAARLAPVVSLLEAGVSGYPGGLMAAIAAGHFGSARIDDVREPILQSLIGGGMTTTEGSALVAMVFDEAVKAGQQPMLVFGYLAFEIVADALVGLPDEPLGETTAAAEKPEGRRRSRTAKPASTSSTPPAP